VSIATASIPHTVVAHVDDDVVMTAPDADRDRSARMPVSQSVIDQGADRAAMRNPTRARPRRLPMGSRSFRRRCSRQRRDYTRRVPSRGAHTPSHVVIEIESHGKKAIITSDSFHHPCHFMDNIRYPSKTAVYSLSCCRTIYLTYPGELVTPVKQVKAAANCSSRLPWVPVRHGQWRVAVVASQVEQRNGRPGRTTARSWLTSTTVPPLVT
jgi:hypothetical protein